METADNELPTYILAYLLQHDYKQTAAAFIQECSLLPSEAVMVFPETTLQNIVSEYKAHKDTRVMLNAMGNVGAWDNLWYKLNSTVKQMKAMADELFCHKRGMHIGSAGKEHSRSTRPNPAQSSRSIAAIPTVLPLTQAYNITYKPSIQPSHRPPPPPQVVVPTSLSFSSSSSSSSTSLALKPAAAAAAAGKSAAAMATPVSLTPPTSVAQLTSATPQQMQSPHKRKTAPKRKLPESPYKQGPPAGSDTPPQTTSTAPAMQLLETFLGDNLLPEKLAEIINKCVTKEAGPPPSELLSATLPLQQQQQRQMEGGVGGGRGEQQGVAESEHQLSPSTMENIFNLTFSDPIFEGVLAGSDDPGLTLPHFLPSSSSSSSSALVAPQAASNTLTTLAPSASTLPSTNTQQQFNKTAMKKLGSYSVKQLFVSPPGTTAGEGGRCRVSTDAAAAQMRHRPVEVKIVTRHGDVVPANKRARLSEGDNASTASAATVSNTASLPSEMDIERFLDQIHK